LPRIACLTTNPAIRKTSGEGSAPVTQVNTVSEQAAYEFTLFISATERSFADSESAAWFKLGSRSHGTSWPRTGKDASTIAAATAIAAASAVAAVGATVAATAVCRDLSKGTMYSTSD